MSIGSEPSIEAKALARETQNYYVERIFEFMEKLEGQYCFSNADEEHDEFANGIDEGINRVKSLFMEVFNVKEEEINDNA